VRAWDDWAAAHVPGKFANLLEGRRRSPLIAADLEVLGGEVPEVDAGEGERWFGEFLRGDAGERDAAFLGAMYVMEGSTLGGQYIARQVEKTLGLAPGRGDAYFRGYGDETGPMWRAFKAVLAEVPERHSELVVRSAKRVFAFFAAQMTDRAANNK
jgi:heme oxygenase